MDYAASPSSRATKIEEHNMSRHRIAFAAFVVLGTITSLEAGSVAAGPEDQAPPPSWPKIALVRAAGPFHSPTHVTGARDDSGRLFVVEQAGRIVIVKNGTAAAIPFLDIRDRVRDGGERGLLSVAFPPELAEKKRFYVDYTDRNGDTIIARFGLGASGEVADPKSEQIL